MKQAIDNEKRAHIGSWEFSHGVKISSNLITQHSVRIAAFSTGIGIKSFRAYETVNCIGKGIAAKGFIAKGITNFFDLSIKLSLLGKFLRGACLSYFSETDIISTWTFDNETSKKLGSKQLGSTSKNKIIILFA